MKNAISTTADVLIVDDYEPNLLALKATLDGPQYRLFEAETGFQAVELCKNQEFALIILDVQMPGMDGFEAAKQIKTSGLNRETPIIFVTAFYQADPFVQKGYEAGAIDYFGKPFDPSILKAKVNIYTELFLKTKRIHETAHSLRAHDQMKSLLDAIPVGIVVADVDGKIFEYNVEAHDIWGGIKHEHLQEYKAWWPQTGKRVETEDWPLARALKTGEVTKDEVFEIECFNGERKTVKNSACPIKGRSGQIKGAVAVFQNVDNADHSATKTDDRQKWKWLTRLSS